MPPVLPVFLKLQDNGYFSSVKTFNMVIFIMIFKIQLPKLFLPKNAKIYMLKVKCNRSLLYMTTKLRCNIMLIASVKACIQPGTRKVSTGNQRIIATLKYCVAIVIIHLE